MMTVYEVFKDTYNIKTMDFEGEIENIGTFHKKSDAINFAKSQKYKTFIEIWEGDNYLGLLKVEE